MLGSESRASKSPESTRPRSAIHGETGGGRTAPPGEALRELLGSASAGTLTLSPKATDEIALVVVGPVSVSSCVSVRICSALRSTRLAVWRCASSSSA